MQRRRRAFGLRCGAAAAVLALCAHGAAAQPVRYDFDSGDPLLADGFTLEQDKPQSTFEGGQLHTTTALGYSEWMLRTDTGEPVPTTGWLVPGSSSRGYRIELRMQLISRDCSNDSMGPGLWIADGAAAYRLYVLTSSLHLDSNVSRSAVATTTDAPHVYRLEGSGLGHVRVFLDDVQVFDETLSTFGGGAQELMFGDLGGCMSAESIWDYLEYDTFGPGSPPGDQDADGVDDAVDSCVFLADATQADGDGDGVGDACDRCPIDMGNDGDRDGVCDSDDHCPGDTRNDQDGNGVCDTEQCMPFEAVPMPVPTPAPPIGCPAVCRCSFFGVDPIDMWDNFGGTGGGAGASGTSGAAGAAGTGSGNGVGLVGTGGASGGGSQAGGAAASNGSSSSAAGAPAAEPSSAGSDGGGCSLRTPTRRGVSLGLAFAVLGLVLVRRRASRAQPPPRECSGRPMLRSERSSGPITS